IQLKEVIINKFENGVFHALLVCENNRVISEIDARTSDAVALAIRFQCPIFAYEPVMEEAGIIVTDENEPEKTTKTKESGETFDEFSEYLIEELEEMLQIAVEKEAYEKASRLRDEIQRRKSAL
ncbi:MAG: bifunctional nuclease family protein, partial [Bacteroidales bacterium]|nr:bifunctional nuclease family protein [Bacteroidales bacterium]